MDLKEKLAPTTERLKMSALAAEQQVLRLPVRRMFQSRSRQELPRLIERWGSNVIISAYAVGTGKALNFGLKHRELNRYGRVLSVVNLVLSSTMVLAAGHELWMRKRGPVSMHDLLSEVFTQDGRAPKVPFSMR